MKRRMITINGNPFPIMACGWAMVYPMPYPRTCPPGTAWIDRKTTHGMTREEFVDHVREVFQRADAERDKAIERWRIEREATKQYRFTITLPESIITVGILAKDVGPKFTPDAASILAVTNTHAEFADGLCVPCFIRCEELGAAVALKHYERLKAEKQWREVRRPKSAKSARGRPHRYDLKDLKRIDDVIREHDGSLIAAAEKLKMEIRTVRLMRDAKRQQDRKRIAARK